MGQKASTAAEEPQISSRILFLKQLCQKLFQVLSFLFLLLFFCLSLSNPSTFQTQVPPTLATSLFDVLPDDAAASLAKRDGPFDHFLGKDVWRRLIMARLDDPGDLGRLSRVCYSFRQLIMDSEELWRWHFLRYCGPSAPAIPAGISVRELVAYRARHSVGNVLVPRDFDVLELFPMEERDLQSVSCMMVSPPVDGSESAGKSSLIARASRNVFLKDA
jgi:hypothetical protein